MVKTTPTSIPYNGSGTINIHINNPSANMGSMPYMPMVMPYMMPMVYPMYCYPPNYYYNNYNTYNTNPNQYAQQPAITQQAQQVTGQQASSLVQTPTVSDVIQRHINSQNSQFVAPVATNPSTKQRQIVVLTDNYIKNLENYLRNPSSELRKSAIKEVLDRFKEDKSRMNNPSLTALLNIALQDTSPTVRALAMAILSSGYAVGDNTTQEILKKLQTSKTNFSADATQAADTLLKMSQNKVLVPDNSHQTYQNTSNNTKGK